MSLAHRISPVTHKFSFPPTSETGVTEMMSQHFSRGEMCMWTDDLIPVGTSVWMILLVIDLVNLWSIDSEYSSDIPV